MSRFTGRRFLLIVLLAVVCTIAASEAAHRFAGRSPQVNQAGAGCAILVLGSPAGADGSPTEEQRSRVDAGLRGAAENRCDLVVVSGGAVKNRYNEAAVMAKLASRLDTTHRLTIVQETQAANTWENVRHSLPLLQGRARIFIASDGLHAQRGRRYLCKQSPDLCGSTGVVAAQMPWRRLPYRLGSSIYELRAWIRDSLLY